MLLANLPERSNAQQVDTETGNIVYTTVNPAPATAQGAYTWGGFTTTESNGGGLFGGFQPGYNTSTGTFMFGFMPGTVSYGIAVNAALQAAGTGIQVNGFRYSWNYLNQDFSKGTLTGNISLTNSGGSVVESYNYNMPNTTNGWTLMSGVQNFNTQYAPISLGGLGVSFSGKDDRFWAGYYGPQIKDIDVRLLYSTGSQPPTDSNPACTAYSTEPKCLAALTVSSTSPTTTTSVTNDTTTPTTTVSSTQPTTSGGGSTSGTTTEVTSTPPTTTSSSTGNANGSTTGTGSPAPGTTSVASAAPTATNPQPKVGDVSDSAKSAQPQQGGSSSGGASLSMILNIVAGEQTRLANVERSVVQQAVEQAVKEAEKTQKDAERIAGTAQQQSIAASMQSTLNQTLTTPTMNVQPGQGTGLTFFSPIQQSGIGLSGSRSVQQGSIDPIARQDSPIVVGAVQQSVVRPSFSLTTNTVSITVTSTINITITTTIIITIAVTITITIAITITTTLTGLS